MNLNDAIADDGDTLLEAFVADLTEAAYPVALRHGAAGSWVDLELDLWKALAGTVKKWEREWPRAGWPGEVEVWREEAPFCRGE